MKVAPIILALFVSCTTIQAQDAVFTFHSPFGSDGTNQPNIDAQSRNQLVLDHIWNDYIRARREINKPLPKADTGGYGQAQSDHSFTMLRYGDLLQTMAELRAFNAQNKGYTDKPQKDEIARMDKVLRSLNLYYQAQNGQRMVGFCEDTGVAKIIPKLAAILFNNDGTPRPIPPMQLGFHQIVAEGPH